MTKIIVDNPGTVLKTYSALTLLANILISISVVGFGALGAINLKTTVLVSAIGTLSLIGFLGRFIKQDLEGAENGPMGFKGVTIRFALYVKKSVLGLPALIKEKFNSFFGKTE